MPSSRSAPNRRCAVPGTPIMPAPSRLTSATFSMLVMPLTGSSEFGLRADQRAGLLGREGVADPDRDVAADGRRHGLRMDHLGAEVRQLHRLVVRQRVDDLWLRHAARIGRQHAVDVGPDVDLAGIEQRAEDRGGEVAAVAAQRGLHAAAIAAMKPVMISVPWKSGADQRRRASRATRPTALPGPSGPHSTTTHGARVDPLAPAPGRLRRASKKRWNSCVDHSSP